MNRHIKQQLQVQHVNCDHDNCDFELIATNIEGDSPAQSNFSTIIAIFNCDLRRQGPGFAIIVLVPLTLRSAAYAMPAPLEPSTGKKYNIYKPKQKMWLIERRQAHPQLTLDTLAVDFKAQFGVKVCKKVIAKWFKPAEVEKVRQTLRNAASNSKINLDKACRAREAAYG